jgi:excisionase family DNA binding protein
MTLIGLISTDGPGASQPVLLPEPLWAEWLAAQKEVFDLDEAAAFLKASADDVLRMVKEQGLPARKVGEGWRFLKAAVCDWLRAGPARQMSRKEAQLALAGKYRDDPDLKRICEDAYKERGRPISLED